MSKLSREQERVSFRTSSRVNERLCAVTAKGRLALTPPLSLSLASARLQKIVAAFAPVYIYTHTHIYIYMVQEQIGNLLSGEFALEISGPFVEWKSNGTESWLWRLVISILVDKLDLDVS